MMAGDQVAKMVLVACFVAVLVVLGAGKWESDDRLSEVAGELSEVAGELDDATRERDLCLARERGRKKADAIIAEANARASARRPGAPSVDTRRLSSAIDCALSREVWLGRAAEASEASPETLRKSLQAGDPNLLKRSQKVRFLAFGKKNPFPRCDQDGGM